MREQIATLIESVIGEQTLPFWSAVLCFATLMDAEVGQRIYRRMTKLVSLLTPSKTPAEAPATIEPYRLRRVGNSAGHRF